MNPQRQEFSTHCEAQHSFPDWQHRAKDRYPAPLRSADETGHLCVGCGLHLGTTVNLAPVCSSNTPNLFLPQGICTGCSLCLVHTSPLESFC